jgi:hypothetical protein
MWGEHPLTAGKGVVEGNINGRKLHSVVLQMKPAPIHCYRFV